MKKSIKNFESETLNNAHYIKGGTWFALLLGGNNEEPEEVEDELPTLEFSRNSLK